MKIPAWQWFKVAVAVGAGYELGRIAPRFVIRMASKRTIQDIKKQYRRRMKEAEARGETVNMADYTFLRPKREEQ